MKQRNIFLRLLVLASASLPAFLGLLTGSTSAWAKYEFTLPDLHIRVVDPNGTAVKNAEFCMAFFDLRKKFGCEWEATSGGPLIFRSLSCRKRTKVGDLLTGPQKKLGPHHEDYQGNRIVTFHTDASGKITIPGGLFQVSRKSARRPNLWLTPRFRLQDSGSDLNHILLETCELNADYLGDPIPEAQYGNSSCAPVFNGSAVGAEILYITQSPADSNGEVPAWDLSSRPFWANY